MTQNADKPAASRPGSAAQGSFRIDAALDKLFGRSAGTRLEWSRGTGTAPEKILFSTIRRSAAAQAAARR